MSNKVIIGKVLKYLEQVGSTNEAMKEMARDEALDEGFTIYTLNQISGRGQQGKEWVNSPGESLALSVFLKPDFLQADQAYGISVAIAVATREFLEETFDLPAEIKWPNDIYIKDKKVSGILIENQIQGSKVSQSIIGIGINFNQSTFPEDMPRAASLKMLTGEEQTILARIGYLTQKLDRLYRMLEEGGIEQLKERYLKHMYGLDTPRLYVIDGEEITATARGIDQAGRLLLDIEGKSKAFSQGEVTWIWDEP